MNNNEFDYETQKKHHENVIKCLEVVRSSFGTSHSQYIYINQAIETIKNLSRENQELHQKLHDVKSQLYKLFF